MVAAFDHCRWGTGGAAPVDRHRHARAGRRAARRPPAPRRGDRPGRGGRRRGADQGLLRPRAGLGAVAPARVRAGPADRRAGGRQPGPARRRARRPRPDHLGRQLRGVPRTGRWTPSGGPSASSPSGAGPIRWDRCGPASSRCRPRSAARLAAELAPHDPGPVLDRPARGRPAHRRRPGARLPGPRGGHAPRARSARRAPTTSSAPRCGPLLLDLPPAAPVDELVARLRDLHAAYRDDYAAYYRRHATDDSPPMRGADPVIVLVPGVGMFSFGADARAARIAGEFYVNAINVMRGAEAVSTYAPIPESEKFRIEYWALEEAKLRRLPPPKPLAGRVALVTGGGVGHRAGHRHPAGRRGRGRGRGRPRRPGRGGGRRRARRPRRGGAGRGRRRRRGGGGRGRRRGVRHLRRRGPGGEQRGPVDLQAPGRDDRPPTGTSSTGSWPAARSW